jgi:hypothetical protein
MAPELY